MKLTSVIIWLFGLIQIIGVLMGIYNIVVKSYGPSFQFWYSFLTSVPFLLLSIITGIYVLHTVTQKSILWLSIVYLLQLVQFKVYGLYYFFITGPYFGMGIVKNVGQNLFFWWDSSFFAEYIIIKLVDDKENFFLTINVIGIFFLTLLFLIYRIQQKSFKTH